MGFQHNKELAAELGRKTKRGMGVTSTKFREMLNELIEKLHVDVDTNLSELPIKEKAQLYRSLVEFRIAKMRSVENTINVSTLSDDEIDRLIERITNG